MPDSELDTLQQLAALMERLPASARARALRWLSERYTPTALELLEESAKLDPAERFEQLVRLGIIDRDGKVIL